MRGRGSRVRSRGSKVEGRGLEVEGQKSRVASRGSHVEGRVRVSKGKGSKFKCMYVSYRSKERNIFVGTCWLNAKAIVKRLSLATPGRNVIFV